MYFRITREDAGVVVTQFNDDNSSDNPTVVSSGGTELDGIRYVLQRFGDFLAKKILILQDTDDSVVVRINTSV